MSVAWDDNGVLCMSGEFDLDNASLVRDEIELTVEAGDRHLTIDMANVTFLDSTGLHVLISAHLLGLTVTVRNPSPNALRPLQIAGLIGPVVKVAID